MILWFSSDNPAYVQAVYQIETLKADLIKMKLDLSRNEESNAAAQAAAELISDNIEYIQKYAKVVSMKEFTKLRHMRAGELEIIHFIQLAKPNILKSIRITEAEIARLEGNLYSLKSKVLEFKPRG